MLISVKEAADILKMSERSVQLKCRHLKIPKIGNVYQLTEDVIRDWEVKKIGTKIITKQTSKTVTPPKRKNPISVSFIIPVLITLFSFIYFIDLHNQITEVKKEYKEAKKEYKEDIDVLNNTIRLNETRIQKQTIEIHDLKYKDSLRTFKKW